MRLPIAGGLSRSASEKPVADGEPRAVVEFDEEGAEPPLVPAGAGLVLDHAGLPVQE